MLLKDILRPINLEVTPSVFLFFCYLENLSGVETSFLCHYSRRWPSVMTSQSSTLLKLQKIQASVYAAGKKVLVQTFIEDFAP